MHVYFFQSLNENTFVYKHDKISNVFECHWKYLSSPTTMLNLLNDTKASATHISELTTITFQLIIVKPFGGRLNWPDLEIKVFWDIVNAVLCKYCSSWPYQQTKVGSWGIECECFLGYSQEIYLFMSVSSCLSWKAVLVRPFALSSFLTVRLKAFF